MAEQIPLTFEFRADHRFADYFPGSNREVVEQLKKLSSGTGEEFIFLAGKTGFGKSHLLQACCHEASQNGWATFYLDLAKPISLNPEVLAGLENYALVCLDNIDAIAGRDDWELALFTLYNQLRDRRRRLVISAVSTPNELAFNLPDLHSRLNWGLSLKINPLDDADKITALSYRAHLKGFEISPQTARYLLSHYDRNLASLWMLLDKLDTASLAAKRKLTIPFLKQIMS